MIGEGGTPGTGTNLHSNARYRANGCQAAGDPANNAPKYLDRFYPACDANPGSAPAGLATNLAGGGIRHFDGANYSFADGHAKWIKNVTSNASSTVYNGRTLFTQSGSNPTFRLSDALPSG